jgi:DNA-binding transcriptional MerR regulator
MNSKPPLITSDVARIFECSPRRVQQLEMAGILVAVKTSRGQRLFDPDQVETVRQERERARLGRSK